MTISTASSSVITTMATSFPAAITPGKPQARRRPLPFLTTAKRSNCTGQTQTNTTSKPRSISTSTASTSPRVSKNCSQPMKQTSWRWPCRKRPAFRKSSMSPSRSWKPPRASMAISKPQTTTNASSSSISPNLWN